MSGQMDLRERFLAVPVVTRSLMASTMVAVVLNPILGLDDIVCASPHDIVRKGQIWRLALSLFYVPGLLNALIMSFVLYRLASAWEQERGSLRLAYYFFLGVVATNLGMHPRRCRRARRPDVLSPAFLCGPGLLAAFLVLITRSSQGYAGASVNVLGLFAMPTLYFPLLLLVFFALFGANPLESAASVAVGYAWAQGYLDAVIPGDAALQAAERWPALRAVVAARGYVSTMAGPSSPRRSGRASLGAARADRTARHRRRRAGIFARSEPCLRGGRGWWSGGIAAGTGRRLGGGSSPGLSSSTSPTSRRMSPPPPQPRRSRRTSARAPTRTSRTYRVGHSGARRESVVDLRTAGRRRGRAQGRRSRRGRNALQRLRWRTSDG